jgi:gliding motility-associated-like protein
MAQVPGAAVFVQSNGFSIVQHHPEDYELLEDRIHGHDGAEKGRVLQQRLVLRSHAYRVQFLNANPSPRITADKPLEGFNNYFIGNDPSKWATGVKMYQGITLHDIYPNIDARYYSDNGQMKYDLIVRPGGDVSRIAFKYEGADKLDVQNNELVISTSVGKLKELRPFSYQFREKGRHEVSNKWVVKDNVVRFDIKNYDKSTTLVIDPTLVFASFSRSTADNWGFTATYGPDGAMYGGGIVFGTGFPVSTGAFQQQFGNSGSGLQDFDIGIIKLSSNGTTRLYATYIGGSGSDQPHSLVVDGGGNLVLAGRSNSPNYPVTNNGNLAGGGFDIVVTKLNANGTALIGSKKIGGTGDDGVNISTTRNRTSLQYNYGDDGRSEVILDAGGSICVASCSQSSNFPIRGGFQGSSGGKQDGIFLRLPPDASDLSYSTYLGGDGNDAAYVLSQHPFTGEMYVAGGTESSNFPGAGSGSLFGSSRGDIDGFVAIISGNSLRKSTYIGTGGKDQVYGLQFDKYGFPYIMGQTTGSWPIIGPPNNPNPWYQANGKQFIAKLEVDLSKWIYSTVFGSGGAIPDISPVAFLVDRCENVYVSGWGGQVTASFPLGGTSGLTTVSPLQPTTDGKDFYFFVLKRDATAQLYGDFFGQNGGQIPDHVDGGTSRFDRNGVIYQAICANCGGGNFPTTPGVWGAVNPSSSGPNSPPRCNLAMVKIAMNLSGVQAGPQSSINGVPRDTAGCVPLTVDFTDTIQFAQSYEWNFGDGSPQVNTTEPNISHTYNAVGVYRVMLVAIDSNTCNIRDTSYLNIKVGDLKALLDFEWEKLNPCDSLQYEFQNLSVAPSAQPFKPNSFAWDFGDGSPRVVTGTAPVRHRYASAGTYNVKLVLLDSAYCNFPDSLVKQLNVATLVKAAFEAPRTGCVPETVVFKNTSEGGQTFQWSFGDGGTSTQRNPTHTYTAAGTYTISLVVIDSATCNIIDSASQNITVYANPVADFSAAPQPPSVNTPIVFTNLSSPDAIRFKWLFGDGDSLVTTSRGPVSWEYNTSQKYNACLIAYNQNGCADTVCKEVEALVEPLVDVPNAFTPSSGDINSKVMVRGYAIGKMRFIIWNRWGQKVFETSNRRTGWDGRYKGVLQPMEVYAYTLEVEFTDGTRTTKKGDITLIR